MGGGGGGGGGVELGGGGVAMSVFRAEIRTAWNGRKDNVEFDIWDKKMI
jgi:hypothetical protein